MNRELILHQLLQGVYENTTIPLFDYVADNWPGEDEVFGSAKSFGDRLSEEKLVHFSDPHRTMLTITNFGRFWVSKGGYQEYLKCNEHKIKEHHPERLPDHSQEHDLKEELRVARLRFTRYRIITYWWSFGLSLISFFLSLLSLYLILSGRK